MVSGNLTLKSHESQDVATRYSGLNHAAACFLQKLATRSLIHPSLPCLGRLYDHLSMTVLCRSPSASQE